MKSGVYKIVHRESGKCYVGSSYMIQRRWNRHVRELNSGKHPNVRLQNAWSKYGENSFDFLVIEHAPESMVVQREQYWMDCLNAVQDGYNIAPIAASLGGIIPSAETREKMAKAKRGVPRSAETKAKISAYQQTRTYSDETRRRMSVVKIGKSHSEESKLKMSLAAKNRPVQSEETRAKRSAAMKATFAARRESGHVS